MAMKFSLIERIVHKIYIETRPLLAGLRRLKLNNTDFSIISNNCWGGIVYEHFGLPKLSPTIGLYFFADDYVKFISRLDYYLKLELKMISAKNSKYSEELHKRKQDNVPVGVLDDVEIIFLHYDNGNLAKEKWDRRKLRINWDNLIIKFSYMNECNDNILKTFEDSAKKYKKSVVFVTKKYPEYTNTYIVPSLQNGQIGDDTFHFKRYVNIIELINKKY